MTTNTLAFSPFLHDTYLGLSLPGMQIYDHLYTGGGGWDFCLQGKGGRINHLGPFLTLFLIISMQKMPSRWWGGAHLLPAPPYLRPYSNLTLTSLYLKFLHGTNLGTCEPRVQPALPLLCSSFILLTRYKHIPSKNF